MTSSITDGTTAVVPDLIVGYAGTRTGRHVYNAVAGGGMDIATQPAGLRTGSLVALCTSYDTAAKLAALLSGESVLTFADSDRVALGMTFLLAEGGRVEVALDDTTGAVWLVTFDYQEVAL